MANTRLFGLSECHVNATEGLYLPFPDGKTLNDMTNDALGFHYWCKANQIYWDMQTDITNPLVAYDVKMASLARLDYLMVEYYSTNSPSRVMSLDITMDGIINVIHIVGEIKKNFL